MTYQHWKSLPNKQWFTEPISCTCQVAIEYGVSAASGITSIECGNATTKAYPAMGHGWMALCAEHGRKHTEAFDVLELISNVETWA